MRLIVIYCGFVICCFSCSRVLDYDEVPISVVLQELDDVYDLKLPQNEPATPNSWAAEQMISSGEFLVARIDTSPSLAQEFENRMIQRQGYDSPPTDTAFGRVSVDWWPKQPSRASTYLFTPFPDDSYDQKVVLLQIFLLKADQNNVTILIKLTPKKTFLQDKLPRWKR